MRKKTSKISASPALLKSAFCSLKMEQAARAMLSLSVRAALDACPNQWEHAFTDHKSSKSNCHTHPPAPPLPTNYPSSQAYKWFGHFFARTSRLLSSNRKGSESMLSPTGVGREICSLWLGRVVRACSTVRELNWAISASRRLGQAVRATLAVRYNQWEQCSNHLLHLYRAKGAL